MVLPAKIFEIKEKADMGFILQKLRDFREEAPYETESGESVNLVTEILDLSQESLRKISSEQDSISEDSLRLL